MAQWVKGPSLMTWSMKPTGGERQPQSCSQISRCSLLHTWHPHTHTQTWLHTHICTHRHDCIHTYAHTHMTTYTRHTCTHTMCIHPYDNNDNNNKYLKWIHGNYKIIDYFKRVEKLLNSCGFLVSPFRCLFLLDKAPAHSSTRLKIYTKLVL